MRLILSLMFAAAAKGLNTPSVHRQYASLVKRTPLPIVHVYDHCPFCVRVRLALGLKNIKHEIRFVANDDIDTPTALVGKKVTPIFQETPSSKAMPESMDIIKMLDSNPEYGPTGLFKPLSGREDWKQWQEKTKGTNSLLQRPRYMMRSLPEFHQRASRDAFVSNHPIGGFEKDDWKKLPLVERWARYTDAYQESLALIEEANRSLLELDKIIHCSECCTDGGLSLDDIDMWSRLRSLTIVKGLQWPEKLRNYMTHFSSAGDIPLYFDIAC